MTRGYKYRCPTCSKYLQRRGLTKAGTQRWYCKYCKQSSIKPRADLSRAFVLERFVSWLLGKQSQAELNIPARTWRDNTAWCWDIVPKPTLTGEVYPILLIDGIRVGSLVCLVARTPEYVVAWHWVGWESSNTWSESLKQLPPPVVIVCDGQKGVLLAIARCWLSTKVQRCHFHVWQNVRVKLTLNPQTKAGQELLVLTRLLLRGLNTVEQAEYWQTKLKFWEQLYGDFIREKTISPDPMPGQRKWRYTHERLRSAYRQLAKLLKDNQLFSYLDNNLLEQTKQPIPRTTNYVEGGINSQLRTKLKLHRGMSEEHQRRLVEWYLYTRTNGPKPPRNCL